MDNRSKICICYVLSAFLITAFVYSLVSTHFTSINKLEQLRYEVEEITKAVLGGGANGGTFPQIDTYVKKRTEGLWDALVTVKKKLEVFEGSRSSSCGFCKSSPSDLQLVVQEEPNYALQSIGASIVQVNDKPYHATGFLASFFGITHKSNYPENVLDPSMQLGNCYAFKGSQSIFTIKLSHKIFIRAITVEHIPESVSLTGDISNAPKEFYIYGLNELHDLQSSKEIQLGSFQYNNTMAKRAQTFYFINENPYRYCKVKIISNHGNKEQTCIYRLAVHGKLHF